MKISRMDVLTSSIRKTTSELESGMLVVMNGGIVKLTEKYEDALSRTVWKYSVLCGRPTPNQIAGPDFLLWTIVLPVL